MLRDATFLIRDVQLLCFSFLFGVLAIQKWDDPARRWLWFSFLASAAGAVLSFFTMHLPHWLGRSVHGLTIPLSYALFNISLVYFDRKGKRPIWISFLILLAGFPFLLAWRNDLIRFHGDAVGDLMIALECVVTIILLLRHEEDSTRAPRLTMGLFLSFFVLVELIRVNVAFLHGDPDMITPRLSTVCLVTYLANLSLLPVAYIWMMQSRLEWNLLRQGIDDPLTGVLNRRGLESALELELARHRRHQQELTVVILDLDHFKSINDRFGHVSGDTVLVNVARFLASHLRKTDVISRFGGEKFVLVLPSADEESASPVVERLCASLAAYRGWLPESTLTLTGSFGVTGTRGRLAAQPRNLLSEAEEALHRAKANGRNQVCYYGGSNTTGNASQAMVSQTSSLQ